VIKQNRAKFFKLGLACTACTLAMTTLSAAAAPNGGHHQHQVEKAPAYARQVASYRLPETMLLRSDGAQVSFPKEIDDGKPVILNFIYTTCTAVCPILSHSFAELQRKLGAERDQVRMVSISIDPEEDTPGRLAEYAARFNAGQQWRFYTGSMRASVTLQKAFNAYFGGKMHHRPMTFLRASPGQPWVRLEGFATPDSLLKEYRQLVPAQ